MNVTSRLWSPNKYLPEYLKGDRDRLIATWLLTFSFSFFKICKRLGCLLQVQGASPGLETTRLLLSRLQRTGSKDKSRTDTDGECENRFKLSQLWRFPYLLIPSFLFILIRPCSSIRRDRTSWRSRGSSCYRNQFVICGKSTWESLLGGSVFPKFLSSSTFHAPEVIWWWSI